MFIFLDRKMLLNALNPFLVSEIFVYVSASYYLSWKLPIFSDPFSNDGLYNEGCKQKYSYQRISTTIVIL